VTLFGQNYYENGSTTGWFSPFRLHKVDVSYEDPLGTETFLGTKRTRAKEHLLYAKNVQGLRNNTTDREYRKNLIFALCPK
jgi:hypothetical protein